MGMLKVYRGPSIESQAKQFGTPKPDPAKMGGTGSLGMNVTASKVGAPHKKGVKTLGQKAMKPKVTGTKAGY
jgi:hypothetical protein